MTLMILLLAAGASSRMRGADKLLQSVDNAPLIATMARRAMPLCPVLITLPGPDHARAKALADLPVDLIPVPDAEEGMAASIRAGVRALPATASAVMILPADMPDLTTEDLITMAEAWRTDPTRIHRATSQDGRPGHPVIFPQTTFDDLKRLVGDQGARPLLRSAPVTLVTLPAEHALTDLDTPEAWAAWRARR